MALRVLMLRKRLNDTNKELEALRAKDADFESREADLEKSIEEAATEEERSAVEEAIEEFESEKAAHEQAKEGLERQIEEIEGDLKSAEEEQVTDPEPDHRDQREDHPKMVTRNKIFGKMGIVERTEIMTREDVKAFLEDTRACIREKRALTNVGLTIPEVLLGVLRENIMEYSKLYKHVNVRPVRGEGRQIIMGNVPEAVWTDCCANLNELNLAFNDVELNCWKVGGFFAVCNANIEDSDIDLAAEVLTALGQAIGRALDKAILYGTGSRMPLGIVPRLAQTSEPGSYPQTARAWEDLHTSNIKTTSATGKNLFADLAVDFGNAKGKYSRGEKVWVMNEKTYGYIVAQAANADAAGAIVSGVNGVMPIVGGIIEVLDFIPDNNIIAGYFDLYTLAERAGEKFATSEHYRFVADQTVFKGTARYDGQPAIAEGFVAIAVAGGSVSSSVTFAPDDANEVQSVLLPTTATVKSGETLQLAAIVGPGTGTVSWASATTNKATVDSTGLVTGVASGSSVISATCNGLTAQCTVTVTSE